MANYIPRQHYTDPVHYAAKRAVKYDRHILQKVADYQVAEEVLINYLRSNRKWNYKRYY